MKKIYSLILTAAFIFSFSAQTQAADCSALPSHADLSTALKSAVKPAGGPGNGGLDLNMWGSIVNRDGEICAIAMTGADRGDQWPGSRVISAQKANTANAFSLHGLALSTANLYSAVQPGGSLFGLQHSNPVNPAAAYGDPATYGTDSDSMVGQKPGGVNVFGGGLALYNAEGKIVGALGVSGDTSCADHNIAWRTRTALALNNAPGGVGPNGKDGINYDITNGASTGGFGHPTCGGTENTIAIEIGAGK